MHRELDFGPGPSLGTLSTEVPTSRTWTALGRVRVPLGSPLTLVALALPASEVARLAGLPPDALLSLELYSAEVTDEALRYLEGLTHLSELSLQRTPVTDAGLPRLGSLVRLERLDLSGTQVTDAGVRELFRLPKLRSLGLSDTAVSDGSLSVLGSMPTLRSLAVIRTAVTGGGAKALRAARADLRVMTVSPYGTPGFVAWKTSTRYSAARHWARRAREAAEGAERLYGDLRERARASGLTPQLLRVAAEAVEEARSAALEAAKAQSTAGVAWEIAGQGRIGADPDEPVRRPFSQQHGIAYDAMEEALRWSQVAEAAHERLEGLGR